jgi:hypothetical protein
MANMQECIDVLRRRIGDTDTPFTFTDELLTGYVEDAVNQVELDWHRGVTTSFGLFDKEITMLDVTLFCVKAHYLIKLRTKDKADRDNFLMRKGRLTLDNTNQAKDHGDTLKIIDSEYRRVLYQAKNGSASIQGIRME